MNQCPPPPVSTRVFDNMESLRFESFHCLRPAKTNPRPGLGLAQGYRKLKRILKEGSFLSKPWKSALLMDVLESP